MSSVSSKAVASSLETIGLFLSSPYISESAMSSFLIKVLSLVLEPNNFSNSFLSESR